MRVYFDEHNTPVLAHLTQGKEYDAIKDLNCTTYSIYSDSGVISNILIGEHCAHLGGDFWKIVGEEEQSTADVKLTQAINYISSRRLSVNLDSIEELMMRLDKKELMQIAHIANEIQEHWKNGDME